MTPEQARQILSVGPDASEDELKAAFKERAGLATIGKLDVTAQALKEALDFLRGKPTTHENKPCSFCGGTGRIIVGLRQMPCAACDGEGKGDKYAGWS